MAEFTKGELRKWLRAELVALVKDIANVRASDVPEFNQGLDIICAYDTKVEKILAKLSAPDLYEACKQMMRDWDSGDIEIDHKTREIINQALAKVKEIK